MTTTHGFGNTSGSSPPPPTNGGAGSGGGETVARYVDLDFSRGGPADQELMAAAAQEQAFGGRVRLTGDLDSVPAGMTPAMTQWWRTEVAPWRRPALEALKGAFEADEIAGGKARGRFVEYELDDLHQRRQVDKKAIVDSYFRDNRALLESQLHAQRDYDQLKALHGGRDAKRLNRWIYGGGLVVIAVIEFFLNFGSVRAAVQAAPALAAAATLFIAIGIAAAGHFHGTAWRRWSYYFHAHDPERAREGRRDLWFGAGLLTVALGIMTYVRFAFLSQEASIAILRGLDPPNIAVGMISLLLPNFLVYLLSAALAYLMHDKDKDYEEKAHKLDRIDAQVQAVRSRQLLGEMARLDAKCAQGMQAVKNMAGEQRMAPNYNRNCEALERFKAKDEQALGALERYRGVLVTRLRREGAEPVFELPLVDSDGGQPFRVLDAEAWLAEPLRAKMTGLAVAQ